MTQSALARSAGVSQAHISAIETGRCSASAELAERLEHPLDRGLVELLARHRAQCERPFARAAAGVSDAEFGVVAIGQTLRLPRRSEAQ